MKISVIIATYNRLPLLRRTLPLVFKQEFAAEEFEVIVVDDGSRDGTTQYLQTLHPLCSFHHISQANAGQAAAINAGLKIARGEIVLFLDDDIECSPGLVRAHVAAHSGAQKNLVFGPVLVSPGQKQTFVTEWVRHYCDDFFGELEKYPERAESGWFSAFGNANSSGRREFVCAAGGLRENLLRSNDLEFGFRMREAGGRFVYACDAIAHQCWAKPLREIAIDEPRLEGQAEVLICREHPGYRKHSRLMSFGTGPWWKRAMRRALVSAPLDVSHIFYGLANSLAQFAGMRGAAVALLRAAIGTSLFRSAITFCGGIEPFRREFGMRVPALLYHHIGEPQEGEFHALSLPVLELKRQLSWLRSHGYEGITPDDWARWVERGTRLPEKPVIMTFDDAYADMEEHALPLLEQFGFVATIYVVTDEIGGWNHWDQKNGYPALPLMTREQIQRWAKRGMKFAAHSKTHADLRTLSEEQLKEELAGSREALQELLGERVNSFAHPYGFFDERCSNRAAEYFNTVFTCEEGLNDASVPLNRLLRCPMERAFSVADPGSRVRWGVNPLQRLRLYAGLALRRVMGMQPYGPRQET